MVKDLINWTFEHLQFQSIEVEICLKFLLFDLRPFGTLGPNLSLITLSISNLKASHMLNLFSAP